MKKIVYCIFASLITSNAFCEVTWIETDLTEADILHEYQDKILHITTSTFSTSNNDLLTTIVTTNGSFRCATRLPSKAENIVQSLSEEQNHCAMTKAPEKKEKKKKKKSRKKKTDS